VQRRSGAGLISNMDTQPRISLPRVLPVHNERAPQANIPQSAAEREALKAAARGYVAAHRPVPPMPADDLRAHADCLLRDAGVSAL
jgi:geranylgeranyl diphosphate synthase, type II